MSDDLAVHGRLIDLGSPKDTVRRLLYTLACLCLFIAGRLAAITVMA